MKAKENAHEVYHREREYARVLGDPLLGIVIADNIDDAPEEAKTRGYYAPTGLHIIEVKTKTQKQ